LLKIFKTLNQNNIVQVKSQATLETAILFAFSLLLIVGFISYAIIVNNHNLQYETTPFVLSSLKFYNFQTMGSTCSFDFEFQTNTYLPYPKYELTFILNNGQRIVPDYGIYTETVIPVLSNGYQYTFVSNGVPNYNGSVCSVMGQQSVNHAYVKYVSYKNANGKTIVQPVSTNYVFQINSASTIPSQLYNNNTIFITGSVIPYSGYVYINYQNGTAVSGSPFTLGEYIYLPTGNYTLSYTNETYPVSFQYWSSSGGVIIQNTFASTTNMIVINNGEIYLNLRNLLKPSQTFIIYSNKTYSTIPGKFNITADFSKNGFYTYYVNNKPYTGCENVSQTSCVISFSTAGTYTISATFKNSTVFAEATPIQVYVFNPLSAMLSSNETVAQNKTNVLLSVTTYNGLKPFTYSFYVNNAPIQNCIDISTPTCIYNIDNPPNDYVYNYTFIANVSDAGGELVTTNNVIVEGVVSGTIILYNSQSVNTASPFQQMIQINESQFKNQIIYNNNFANFEFIYPNGTVIPAWIESNQSGNLTIWVKLAKAIPAKSKAIIFLKFEGSTNLLSSSGTSGIGEAPQLSSAYAQYDDGASVFTNYWNFAGTSLPSGWQTLSTGQPQLLVYHQISSSMPQVIDTLMTGGGRVLIGIATGTTAGNGPGFSYIITPSINAYGDDHYPYMDVPWGLYYNQNLIHSVIGVATPGVESVGYENGQAIVNYGSSSYNMSSYSQSYLNQNSASYIFLSTDTYGCGGGSAVVVNNNLQLQISTNDYCYFDNILQWVRTRVYPPNGVMPNVTIIQ